MYIIYIYAHTSARERATSPLASAEQSSSTTMASTSCDRARSDDGSKCASSRTGIWDRDISHLHRYYFLSLTHTHTHASTHTHTHTNTHTNTHIHTHTHATHTHHRHDFCEWAGVPAGRSRRGGRRVAFWRCTGAGLCGISRAASRSKCLAPAG